MKCAGRLFERAACPTNKSETLSQQCTCPQFASPRYCNNIVSCLLSVCVCNVNHMRPRCCLVMDQRVGRRDFWSTSYWLLEEDETFRKTACNSWFSVVEREVETKEKLWQPKPRWASRQENKGRMWCAFKMDWFSFFGFLQPVLHGYFRSSCSWRVRIGKSCHSIRPLQLLSKAFWCQQDDNELFVHQRLLLKVLNMTRFQSI